MPSYKLKLLIDFYKRFHIREDGFPFRKAACIEMISNYIIALALILVIGPIIFAYLG